MLKPLRGRSNVNKRAPGDGEASSRRRNTYAERKEWSPCTSSAGPAPPLRSMPRLSSESKARNVEFEVQL